MSGLKDFIDGVMRWVLEIAFVVGNNTNNGKKINNQLVRLLFVAALTVYGCKQLVAQQFSELCYDDRPAMRFSSIESLNKALYVSGVTATKVAPLYKRAVIGKLSDLGIADTFHVYIDTTNNYEIFKNCLRVTTEKHLLAVGSFYDSVPKVFLMECDTNGSVLLWQEYTYPNTVILTGSDVVKIQGEGYLVAINADFTNGNSDVLVLRTDTDGVEINTNIYSLGSEEWPWLIRPMLNGNYMVGTFSMKNSNSTPFWTKTWLIEIDSMGNYVNQWIDTDNKNLWPYGMQQTADSGWIIVRQHLAYDIGGFQKYNAGIVKYDKNFGKEWEHYHGDSSDVTGFYDVEILSDGKYIVCGTTPIWGSDSAHRFGWIVKFDTDGTMLWERKYVALERNGTHSYLYDIDVLPNGDLLACGELKFTINVGITPIQQGWILRTDSNGCVIENCLLSSPLTPEEGTAVHVIPNPASSQIQITLPDEMQDAEVKIFDVAGKVVKEFKAATAAAVVEVSDLNKGLYLIAAEKEGKFARGKLVVE